MALFRQTANVIELARDLMAVISPATGTRATGVVRFSAESADVFLQRNWAMIPVVNGAARDDLLFKVAVGPDVAVYRDGMRVKASPSEPDAQSWWTITNAGVDVNVVSIVGGARHNLIAGTEFILDPKPEGINAVGVLQDDMVNGVDPTHFAGCMSVTQFEQLGSAGLDVFRAQPTSLPAVVIVWSNTEPADGTTQSPLTRAGTRVGSARQLFKEHFNLFVLSRRDEGSWVRRGEGLKLLDDVVGLLTDRQAVDGEVFSAPTGIQFTGRSRVLFGDNSAYQNVYVYVAQLAITGLVRPYDFRTYNPWLRTNATYLSEKNEAGERLTLVDHSFLMTTASDEDEMTVVSSLAALPTLTDKELAWVSTLKCYYHRNQFSTQVPDGFMVISTTTAGNWERMVETTSRDWTNQAQWYVDPVTGNDENTGSLASPLATLEEFFRRISVAPLTIAVTVTVGATAAFSKTRVFVDIGLTGSLKIEGTPTPLLTGTLATFTPLSHGGNTADQITSAAVPDWTSHVGRRLRMTSGAANGSIVAITNVNPGGLGVHVARISQPSVGLVSVTPASGDSFVIESLPSIGDLEIEVNGAVANPPGNIRHVTISSLGIKGISWVINGIFAVSLDGCRIGTAGSICRIGGKSLLDSNTLIMERCHFVDASFYVVSELLALYCYFKSFLVLRPSSNTWTIQYTTFDGTAQYAIAIGVVGHLGIYGCQIFGYDVGINIAGEASIIIDSFLSGVCNLCGISVGDWFDTTPTDGCKNTTIYWKDDVSTPTLQGGTAQLRVWNSDPNNPAILRPVDLAWVDAPFSSDRQYGTATLLNGTVQVTARNTDVRPPMVTRDNLIGTPGYLQVPAASRTTSSFVIESRDATGLIEAGDNSVVQWLVPQWAKYIWIGPMVSLK